MANYFKVFLLDYCDGHLFAGTVPITTTSDGRLRPDTAEALNLAWGRVVGSAAYYRCRSCRICGQWFLGHHSRQACSDSCSAQLMAERLLRRLDLARFVVMRKPPSPDMHRQGSGSAPIESVVSTEQAISDAGHATSSRNRTADD